MEVKTVKITKEMAVNRFRKFCEKHCESIQGRDWAYGYWQAMKDLGLFDILEDDRLLYEYNVIKRKCD